MSRAYLLFVSLLSALVASALSISLQTATIPTLTERDIHDVTVADVERDRAMLQSDFWTRTLFDEWEPPLVTDPSPWVRHEHLVRVARKARIQLTVATVGSLLALIAAGLGLVRALTLRPGRSVLIVAAIVLLTLDIVPPLLLLTSSERLGALAMLFVVGEAFALFVAANLLPVPAHPWIANLERELARLPRSVRRTRLARKIGLGTVLFVGGAGASIALSLAVPGLTVVFSGLTVIGLLTAGSSVAVAARGLAGAR